MASAISAGLCTVRWYSSVPAGCMGIPGAKMLGREWATRGLRQGDLTALAAIARGKRAQEQKRRKRLAQRGFITSRAADSLPSVTLRGRLALFMRTLTKH
jgi:hypothetical protein